MAERKTNGGGKAPTRGRAAKASQQRSKPMDSHGNSVD